MGIFKNLFQDFLERAEPLPEEEDMPEDPAPQELKDAEIRCPDVKFVISCREFFNKRGFLSAKQKNALTFAGTPNRKRRQFGEWEDQDYDPNPADFGDNPFDPDR